MLYAPLPEAAQTIHGGLNAGIVESLEPLVNIRDQHRIFVKPMYFEQQIEDSLKTIYLRKNAYERLREALALLPENYSFILYDGYRPLQVQEYLFQYYFEEFKRKYPRLSEKEILEETLKYVAYPSTDPSRTSPHVTGGAIDLTLGDLEGNPCDLGSVFDEMSEKSATRYFEQHPHENKEALKNRRLLFNCLMAAGIFS